MSPWTGGGAFWLAPIPPIATPPTRGRLLPQTTPNHKQGALMTTKTYRQGAVGALMDEYERAAGELVSILSGITDEEFERIRDTKTQDQDCRSIQTIMRHVIRAGYGYAGYMRTAWGKEPVIKWDQPVSH